MFAVYIPTWSGAVERLPIQLALIAIVAVAIFIFARRRHAAVVVALSLLAGIAFGTALGLLTAKWYDVYWHGPASFFELYRFQISGSIGAIFAWLSLELVAFVQRRTHRTA